MKIALDISPIQYRGTGVGRYLENFCLNLLKIDQENQYTFFYNSFRNRLSDLEISSQLQKFANVKVKEFYLPEKILHKLWNDWQLFDIQKLIGPQDLFYYSDWFLPPFKGKKITTVHDLIFKKYPETVDAYVLNTQKKRFRFLHNNYFYLITDSQATKADLIEEGFKSEDITVVYPGITVYPQGQKKLLQIRDKFKLNKNFILTVGKIEPRKNYRRLLAAFLALQKKDLDLVIVGSYGWGEADYLKETIPAVRVLNQISDSELSALYQEALFFIMPSLYEGFGFPAAEAMALGCPTALSNTSSLREIGQGASLLFNPLSEKEIEKAMTILLSDENLRLELKQKGLLRAKNFTWEKATREILHIIKKL